MYKEAQYRAQSLSARESMASSASDGDLETKETRQIPVFSDAVSRQSHTGKQPYQLTREMAMS